MTNIVKTYEQFNELDPYNEEIWDDNKSNLQFLYEHLLNWLDAFLPKLIEMVKLEDKIIIDVNGTKTMFFIEFHDNIKVKEVGKRLKEKIFDTDDIENFAKYISDSILESMGF